MNNDSEPDDMHPCHEEDLFNTVSGGLFFIVGCGRSGTTLLQSIISNHSDVKIPAETGFYPLVYDHYKNKSGDLSNNHSFNEALDVSLAFWRVKSLGLNDDLVRRLASYGPQSWETIFVSILSAFAIKSGVKRVGEKSPHHVNYLGLLGKRFPKAKFIHMVRDPRAVALSFQGLKADFGRKYVSDSCRQWKNAIQMHQIYASQLGGERYCVVHYEELIESPAIVVKDLCRFLGIEFSSQMLDFHNRAKSGFHQEQSEHMENTTKPLFSSSVDKWKTELSRVQIGIVERTLEKEMAQVGYKPSLPASENFEVAVIIDRMFSVTERVSKKMKNTLGKL